MTATARDWSAVVAGFRQWLQEQWPDAEHLEVDLRGDVLTNGFSSETAILEARWQEAGDPVRRPLVLRLPPSGNGTFETYDLELQAKVQKLAGERGVPVPSVVGWSTDHSYVGTDFVAMDYVAGRVPADQAPQYCAAGWLYDAETALQRRMYESFHDVLADINSITPDQADLRFLERAEGPGLRGEVEWWANYLQWASDGSPPAEIVDTLEWLRQNMPRPEPPPSLLWGDARFGNAIFGDDFTVKAVLDWEMASVGPAEVDLGWSFANRRSIQMGNGKPLDHELPGFPDRAETIRRYERRLGRSVQPLDWYEVFGMMRIGACLLSLVRLLRGMGVTDHIVLSIPPIQGWAFELMGRA